MMNPDNLTPREPQPQPDNPQPSPVAAKPASKPAPRPPKPLPDGCYRTLDAFLDAPIMEPEEILHGLHRGEVAVLISDDAAAKTNFLLTLGLALAAGNAAPYTPAAEYPTRVVYLNGDAAPARLQRQLQTM